MQNKIKVDLTAAIKIRNEHAFLINTPYKSGKINSVFIAPADLDGFHSYCENKKEGMDEEINLMQFSKNKYSIYVRYEFTDADGDYYILLVDYLKETGKDFNFVKYGLKPFSVLAALTEFFFTIQQL